MKRTPTHSTLSYTFCPYTTLFRSPAEWWMRCRDRRAAMAALILFAAYIAMGLWTILWGIGLFVPVLSKPLAPLVEGLLWLNLGLMLWRGMMRALFVEIGRAHV